MTRLEELKAARDAAYVAREAAEDANDAAEAAAEDAYAAWDAAEDDLAAAYADWHVCSNAYDDAWDAYEAELKKQEEKKDV